jgi:hypothetical protein
MLAQILTRRTSELPRVFDPFAIFGQPLKRVYDDGQAEHHATPRPTLVVDNGDDAPRATRHAGIFSNKYAPRMFDPFGNVNYVGAAAKALDQAERDLADARARSAEADRKKERNSEIERAATLTERQRLIDILFSPVGLRNPSIAKRVAFETSSPSAECIAALKGYERENAVRAIVHAARRARGEDPHGEPIIPGPRQSTVKMNPEDIIAAGKRRRGQAAEDTMPPEGSLAWQIVMAARRARGQD